MNDSLNPKDIIYWSDNLIKVFVPNSYLGPAYLYKDVYKTAGSGKINVRNDGGYLGTSANILHITHNFYSDTMQLAPNSSGKDYYKWANQRCKTIKIIRCHRDISDEKKAYIFQAARDWNKRLGYTYFEIDPTPTLSTSFAGDTCIIKQSGLPTGSDYVVLSGTFKRNAKTEVNSTTTRDGAINNGFDMDLALNALDGTSNNFMYDSTGLVAKPANTTDFYAVMLHEFGHALGLGHAIDPLSTASSYIDAELMGYRINFYDVVPAAQRKTLLSSGGESLKGAKNLLALSQATTWAKSNMPLVGTIGVPIPPISVSSTITTLCGYKQGRELLTLATGANYQWQNQPPGGGQFVDIPTNDPNFIGSQTNLLKFNYNAAFDPNGYSIRCNINNNGCGLVGGIDAATATLRTISTGQMPVLQPIPARCKSGTAAFTPVSTPSTPSGGTYSLYTMAGVLVPNAMVNPLGSQINGSAVGFGKYQLRYTVTNACGTVYDSKTLTLVSCNGIQPRINTLYKDATNYTDINSFCLNSATAGAFSLSYTVLGIAAAGDSIKVQLSNTAGVFPAITKSSSFIAKKLAVAGTNKTDIITGTVPYPSTPAGSAYKMRLLHKNTAATPAIVYDTIAYPITMAVSATLGGPCAALDPNNNKAQGRMNTHTDGDEPLTPVTAIAIYPNPSTGIFTVALPDTDGKAATNIIEVLDINGRLLLTANTTTPQTELNLSNYATGIYLVRVHWHGEVTTHKVVISE